MDPLPKNTMTDLENSWAIYAHVGLLSIMLWDIITHAKQDLRLLFKQKINLHSMLYFVSRAATLLFAATKASYLTVTNGDCRDLVIVICVFYMFAIGGTLLLVSIRLRLLLYRKTKTIMLLCATFLFAIVGGIIFTVGIVKNEPTTSMPNKACVDPMTPEYIGAAFCSLFAYHMVMLASIIVAVHENVIADKENLTLEERYERMVRGGSLYLENALTAEDRVFHLSATLLSLGSLIWFFASKDSSSGSFRLIPVVVYIVCTHILMGRVFRKSTVADGQGQPPNSGTMRTATSLKVDIPFMDIGGSDGSNNDHDSVEGDMRSPRMLTPVLQIEVSKIIEHRRDVESGGLMERC